MKNARFQIFSAILFFVISSLCQQVKAQQSLTQINGWNAYVHLPAGYSTSTKSYPTIVFFPGLGEIGTNPNSVISNGPGAYIAQGWNGNVTVDGDTVEFIVISLQPPNAFPSEVSLNLRIQTITSLYRTDPNRLYLTGLSHGGWCSATYVTGDAYGGPYNYASKIAAVVTVQGMKPDDNQPYPNLFDNFALSGGKYLAFEQINDGRDARTVIDRMNLTAPNSGIYVQTTFGGGGHCCWNRFYGGQGTQPGIFNLSGTNQNIYQWLGRQTRATNIPPVSNAGADITLTLPVNQTVLNGSGSDADGTVTSFLWSQIAGPSAATLSTPNLPVTTISNLVQGQYKFILKVTDNSTAIKVDTVMVTVNQDPATSICNSSAPVTYYLNNTSPGQIYRPNGSMWKGGDTIKITGTNYSVIEFYNIAGDQCRPLVIMPLTTLLTPQFRFKGNSRHIKLWGGITPYGIKVSGGSLAITMSHHIEVDNVECYGGSIGVYCKTDVSYDDTMTWHPNYRMTKFSFRNMWIHDINGEGMYLGVTLPDGLAVRSTYSGLDTVILPIRLDSVEVSNCIVERTAWDAIQLSNARDGNKIFNNTIRNYGTLNMNSQQAGIILGGNCNGDVYGNTITKGSGNGIQIFGYGTINVNNNILDSCGYDGAVNPNGTQGQQSIYASDYLVFSDYNPKQQMNVYGNRINRPKTAGGIFITDYFNNSLPSLVSNNILCIPSAPVNWEYIYVKAYVPGSTVVGNTQSCSAVNIAPTANAGLDANITLPTNSAGLNGSGTDADGTIVSYSWIKIAGPAAGSITNASSAITTASGLVQGVYRFQLTVTDNAGAIARDTMNVTVNGAANQLPTANAGLDANITLPTNSAGLNGSGTDADGTIVSYSWIKIAGPAAGSITNASSAITTASGLVQGVYRFQLTVTDNGGAIARDTMNVTVNGAANQLPTANAGLDANITLPTNSAGLNGSGTDPDGTIVSYGWIKIAGPAAGSITNASSAITTASGLVQGVYRFQLTVTDNAGAIARDTMNVTVNGAANQLPTANAGLDANITLPTNSAGLNGSGTDPDGTIVSYGWIKIAGPAAGSITNASSAITTASGLVQGVYRFQLTVTDNAGAIARDTMNVTVNGAANQLPTANAGLDANITLPTNSAGLNGSGTDPDGTIVSYGWIKIAGPAAGSITNASSAITTASGLVQGVYRFQLTVTDNAGAIARDTMNVTVNGAANQLPTANAGLDANITLPTNSAGLNGSGTDPDGTIVSYGWIKIAGPAAGSITNASSAITTASGLVQGVYRFQLTVTDNAGAIARDTMNVTVNGAVNQLPIANAGLDANITLPTNSAGLNGSGTDPDGTIVSYGWIKIAGPAAGSITNASSAITTASGLVQGVYRFQLTVTDNGGAISRDTMNVTVNGAANQLPIANAGDDISIYLPQDSATLNGVGTDVDGNITAYSWRVLGPVGQFLFQNSQRQQTQIKNLQQGVYTIELTVTDNKGAKASDTMMLTVGSTRQTTVSEKMQIYPNPVSNMLHVEIESPKVNEVITLRVYDIRGVMMLQRNIGLVGNSKIEIIDVSHLKTGTYLVQINYSTTKQIVKKVVKM